MYPYISISNGAVPLANPEHDFLVTGHTFNRARFQVRPAPCCTMHRIFMTASLAMSASYNFKMFSMLCLPGMFLDFLPYFTDLPSSNSFVHSQTPSHRCYQCREQSYILARMLTGRKVFCSCLVCVAHKKSVQICQYTRVIIHLCRRT